MIERVSESVIPVKTGIQFASAPGHTAGTPNHGLRRYGKS